MKKTIIILLLVLIIIGLAGYAFQKKYADSSETDYVLINDTTFEELQANLFYFDGNNTTIMYCDDKKRITQMLKELTLLKLKKVATKKLKKMKAPYYGLMVRDNNPLTYSNGLWYSEDGSVYKADYDFEKTYSDLSDSFTRVIEGGAPMPNSYILGEYDIRFYTKVTDMPSEKNGIQLSVKSFEHNSITVVLKNTSHSDFLYGEKFSLQKEIDGNWYRLPTKMNVAFHQVGLSLDAGHSEELTYDIGALYGDLKKGHYRIEQSDLVADFYKNE